MKIAIAGTGYVGLSLATLLAQHHSVTAVDVIEDKVKLINERKSPIADKEIEEYLAKPELNICATTDAQAAYSDADIVVIATPTNYDPRLNFFDTSHVDEVATLVTKLDKDALIVIKSTIPVGHTKAIREKTGNPKKRL